MKMSSPNEELPVNKNFSIGIINLDNINFIFKKNKAKT